MKPRPASSPAGLRPLAPLLGAAALACVLGLPLARAADNTSPAEIKRITERYALTHKRIDALLGPRMNPTPLPANPPNPFYTPPKESLVAEAANPGREPVETGLVPETADISDIDTVRKYAGTLRVGGVINRNGGLYVILNNTPCKVGDVVPVGPKDRPVYLKLLGLSMSAFTLGLNDASLEVPIKK